MIQTLQNRKFNKFQQLLKTALGTTSSLVVCATTSAAPQDASVANGNVTIQSNGPNTVIHASNNAIIDYSSFNIAAHESVRFIQPSATARVLNRVNNGRITRIDGSLFSNGHVYISNPAGIFFNGSATVNVGSLTAAAGSISNIDFLNNVNHFTTLQGNVTNAGSINGQVVNLIGARVQNLGTIITPDGIVTMAAGDDVFLQERDSKILVKITGSNESVKASDNTPGVENVGTIDAGQGTVSMSAGDMFSLAMKQTGTIKAGEVQIAGSTKGLTEVGGDIKASGNVEILGDKIHIDNAQIDASGQVLIGGDYQGGNNVQTASRTYVGEHTTINGDGDNIIIWSDEITAFHGNISSPGSLVEVSSKGSLIYTGNVHANLLLLDPASIEVVNGVGTEDGDFTGGTPDQVLFSDNAGNPSQIGTTVIDNATTPIILQADNTILVTGDITNANAQPITLTTTTGAVTVNGSITTNGVTINSEGANINGPINAGLADVVINAGTGTIEGGATVTGNNVTLNAASIGTGTTVDVNLTGVLSTTTTGNQILTTNTMTSPVLDAGAGDITLTASGTVTNAIATANTLNLLGNVNYTFSAGTNITTLTGTTASLTFTEDDSISLGAITASGPVNVTSSGALTVSGAVDAGSNSVTLFAGANTLSVESSLTSTNGTITLTGGPVNVTGAGSIGSGGANISVTSLAGAGTYDGPLNAGAGNIRLFSNAAVGGAGAITAGGLELLGNSYTLTGNVDTIAGNVTGNVSFTDSNGITVGLVTTDGLTSTAGTVTVISDGFSSVANDISGVGVTLNAGTGELSIASDVDSGGNALSVTGAPVTITGAGSLTSGGGDISLTSSGVSAVGIAGSINAGAGDIQMTASSVVTSGATLINGAGLELLGTGSYVLGGNITTIAGNATGPITFIDLNGVDIGTVNTVGLTSVGAVSVTAAGAMNVNQNVSANGVTLDAGVGALSIASSVNSNGAALIASGTPLNITGAGSLTSGGANITLTSNGAGASTIDGNVNAAAGNVQMTAGGAVSGAGSFTAVGLDLLGAGSFNILGNVDTLAGNTTGAVTYVDTDNFSIGTVTTVGLTSADNVTLTAGTNIEGGQTVTATTVDVTANSIGTTTPLTVSATNLVTDTSAVNGNQSLTSGALTLATLDAGTGNITFNATDAVAGGTVTATGLEILGSGPFTLNGSITTLAGNTTGSVTYADADGVDIGTLNSVGLTATGDIVLNTAGNVNVNNPLTGANVTIDAGVGSIEGGATITGTNVSLTGSSIGTGTVVDVDATNLTTDSNATNGNQVLTSTALSSANLDAGTGDITLTASGAVSGVDATADTLNLLGGVDYTFTGPTNITTLTGTTGALTLTETDSLSLGPVNSTGLITVNAGGNATVDAAVDGAGISIDAGVNDITVNAPVNANAGNLSLTSDTIAINAGLSGSGSLLLQPTTVGQSIGVGNAAAGTYSLDTAEISQLNDGFSGISIGRANGSGSIDVQATTFNDPIAIQSPVAGGNITINGHFQSAGAMDHIIIDGPGATTTLNNDITTNGADITISDSVVVGNNLTINLTSNGGDISITGNIDGTSFMPVPEVLNIDAGLAGSITTGPVAISEDLTINMIAGTINIPVMNLSNSVVMTYSANVMNFPAANSITGDGTGTLILQGFDNATNVRIGVDLSNVPVPATLDLQQSDFLSVTDNAVTLIQIGRATSTGTFEMGTNQTLTFRDPMHFRTDTGTMTVNGAGNAVIGDDNASLIYDSNGGTTLNAGIATDNNDLTINDNVTIGPSGGAITLDGLVGAAGDLTIDGTLNGTSSGSQSLTAQIGDNFLITGDIGTMTPMDVITIISQNGTATFQNIGTAVTPGADTTSVTADSITFSGTTYNAGSQTYITDPAALNTLDAGAPTIFSNTSGMGGIVFSDDAILVPTAGTDLILNSNSGLVSIQGGIQPTASAGVDVTLGLAGATTGATLTPANVVGALGNANADSVKTVVLNAQNTNTLHGDISTGDYAANTITITGATVLAENVSISTNNTVNDGTVTFNSTVDATSVGAQLLAIHSGDSDTIFHAAVGQSVSLADITLTATGPGVININGGILRSSNTNDVTINGNVELDSIILSGLTTVGITEFNGNDLTFNGTINQNAAPTNSTGGQQIIVNSNGSGVTLFSGVIGATGPIDQLTTNTDGTTHIQGNITTVDGQTFNDAVVLMNDDIVLTDATGGILFAQTLDGDGSAGGNDNLTVTVTGPAADTRFIGAVGATNPLNNLTISDTNNLTFNSTLTATGDYIVTTSNMVHHGGTITTAGIPDISGGNIMISSTGDVNVLGSINASGGTDTTPSGGNNGGNVSITTTGGSISVAAIDTSGSNAGAGSVGNGGDAGDISLQPDSGTSDGGLGDPLDDERPDGILTLNGDIMALGGTGDGAGMSGAGGTVTFAGAGRIYTPSVITIRRPGSSFTISALNFVMGQNEKLSVTGTFTFNDPTLTGTATLGDINALGDTIINTGTINLLDRNAAFTINALGQLQIDEGLDFITGGVHDFNVAPVELNGSLGNTNFSNPDARGDLNSTLIAYPYRNFGLVNGNLFSASFGGDYFDFNGTGPSNTNVSEVIAAAIPRPAQTGDVIRDTIVGQAQFQVLADLGIIPRDLTAIEFVWFLAGRGTYNDIPEEFGTPAERQIEIARNRLLYDPIAVLTDTYRALFFTENILPDGSTALVSRRPQVQKVLQDSYNAYKTNDNDQFDPVAFRQFMQNNPEQRESLAVINGLRQIFRQIHLLGLGPAEARAAVQRVMTDIVPEGLTSEQLLSVVNASSFSKSQSESESP